MLTTEEFAQARKTLKDELYELNLAWNQYTTLFESRERVELLNCCAAKLFGLIQRTLLRDVLLSISRLTDQRNVRGKANLVLSTLLEDPALSAESRIELKAVIDDALSSAAPYREHRNKYIAHLDHAVATGDANQILPKLKREDIAEAVRQINRAFNCHGTQTIAQYTSLESTFSGDARALIEILESSAKWERHLARKGSAGDDAHGP